MLTSSACIYVLVAFSLSLRMFSDPAEPEKMWKASVQDINGEILCVSQFTLMANTSKGNKPDFHRAMVGLAPVPLSSQAEGHITTGFGRFSRYVRQISGKAWSIIQPRQDQRLVPCPLKPKSLSYTHVLSDGKFGAMMDVSLTNEVHDSSSYRRELL